jgi:hypothetical protein
MLAIAFGAVNLLWIAAGAGAPVVIHLIMRTKPRRVVFPALQFVRKTHKANLSKLRLKHLLLLLMRMAAIALIALLLAQPLSESQAAPSLQSPAAVVVVVDDSYSMGYEFKSKSLYLSVRDSLKRLVGSFPEGSQFAVVTSSRPELAGGLTGSLAYVEGRLDEIQPGQGHASLAEAINRGVALLAESPLARKQLYVVSDMTRWSWRDVSLLSAPEGIDYAVVNARKGGGANVSLSGLGLSARRVPVGQEVVLEASVESRGVSGKVRVSGRTDRRFLGEKEMTFSGQELYAFQATLPSSAAGIVQGRVELDFEDALALDNVRYFTVEVMKRPRLLIVRDVATIGQVDATTRAMLAAIDAAGSVEYVPITNHPSRLNAEAIARADIVLLSGVSSLTAKQWSALGEHVEAGGSLWVVAGPLVSASGYELPEARALLPARIEGLESADPPSKWGEIQYDHPLLEPFEEGENTGFGPLEFSRRLALGPVEPRTEVPARYQDGTPALLWRQVGRGEVLVWNFSPAAPFSNMASYPTPLVVLVSRTLTVLPGRDRVETLYTLGDTVVLEAPPELGGVTVSAKGPRDRDSLSLAIDARTRSVRFAPETLGHWQVEFSGNEGTYVRGLSVNPHPRESDLTPIDPDQLAMRFPQGRLHLSNAGDPLEARSDAPVLLELAPLALTLLLVLLICESFFANRFYRQAAMEQSPERLWR